ncbi:MAG: AlbA family DNA-binding domain-containing protein, partial [Burkholderiales bacterium]
MVEKFAGMQRKSRPFCQLPRRALSKSSRRLMSNDESMTAQSEEINESEADPIVRALRYGIETRSTEFKESQPLEVLKWKIVKSAMAMANLRDGGRIIIGGSEREGLAVSLDGVKPEHLTDYDNDTIIQLINTHARPPVDLSVRIVPFDGKEFVGIEVAQFARTPVFCAKPTPNGTPEKLRLREGDVYVRSNERIATTRAVNAELMAEVLEVAAETRAAQIVATAQRIGLRIPDSALKQFAKEISDFEPSIFAKEDVEVARMPRFVVRIAPERYEGHRLTIARCREIVLTSQVRIGGWSFPYASSDRIGSAGNFVHQEIALSLMSAHVEQWRFFRSGQFAFRALLPESVNESFQSDAHDEIERYVVRGRQLAHPIPGFVSFMRLIYRVTEAYVFAARLAQAVPFEDRLKIEFALENVEHWALASGDRHFDVWELYQTTHSEVKHEAVLSIEDV